MSKLSNIWKVCIHLAAIVLLVGCLLLQHACIIIMVIISCSILQHWIYVVGLVACIQKLPMDLLVWALLMHAPICNYIHSPTYVSVISHSGVTISPQNIMVKEGDTVSVHCEAHYSNDIEVTLHCAYKTSNGGDWLKITPPMYKDLGWIDSPSDGDCSVVEGEKCSSLDTAIRPRREHNGMMLRCCAQETANSQVTCSNGTHFELPGPGMLIVC